MQNGCFYCCVKFHIGNPAEINSFRVQDTIKILVFTRISRFGYLQSVSCMLPIGFVYD